MPRDKTGCEVKVGDVVALTADVVDIHGGTDERELVLVPRHGNRDGDRLPVSVSARCCVVQPCHDVAGDVGEEPR